MPAKSCFDWSNRIILKNCLADGMSPAKVRTVINCSSPVIYSEVARGLSEEDYAERRYVRYDPVKATVQEMIQVFGKEAVVEVLKAGKAGKIDV